MEYYFSGTIERIIFWKLLAVFRTLTRHQRYRCRRLDNFEIIVTGTMGDIMEGEDYTFWGSYPSS